jgi:hypothetical protein
MSYAEQVEQEVKGWQDQFAILKDWNVRFNHTSEHKGKVTTNPDLPRATFFPWPEGENTPKDFYLHEILHLALRQYKRTPESEDFDVEEQLVRDICRIWREART